jgi:hypothetical protein
MLKDRRIYKTPDGNTFFAISSPYGWLLESYPPKPMAASPQDQEAASLEHLVVRQGGGREPGDRLQGRKGRGRSGLEHGAAPGCGPGGKGPGVRRRARGQQGSRPPAETEGAMTAAPGRPGDGHERSS